MLVAMYVSVRTKNQFFVAAAVVAIVLGGTQALSRSLFSQMIPKGREAEYFSVYEISDKGTSWMCPLLFGLALQFTGSYRLAILSLVTFFLAGLLVLLTVDVQRAASEAESPSCGTEQKHCAILSRLCVAMSLRFALRRRRQHRQEQPEDQ